MKIIYFKTILLIQFVICCSTLVAQQNDSLSKEQKEDGNIIRKRNYIYFISNRTCEDDKFDIYKMAPSDRFPALVVIRGKLEVIGNTNIKKGRISVYNASNDALIGIYNTSSYTGNYLLILAPNIKYIFKVEVSGYGTTEEVVEVPLKIDYEICQQELKIKLNEKNKPVLLINNFFADENENVSYLKAIVDTTLIDSDNYIAIQTEERKKQLDKNGKSFSNIDELVKKQQEEERKKPEEALKAFKNNDFETALTLYSNILKNDPADPFINYYYGVCLFKLNKNKATVISSLLIAASAKEVPFDVFFYLGKTYHMSYLFQDAIKSFEAYKGKEKPYDFERNGGLLYIKNCINGSNLMNDQVNVEFIKRTPFQLENILKNYNPDLINERLRPKTDFFYSIIDKKKDSYLLATNINSQEYYHISYGEKEQNHTDIYCNKATPNGVLGASQVMGIDMNTPYDENYPYLTKDGKTLYFSSKGHNSMGGFDIFKCVRKDSLSGWSKPQNMGYPINSTYDDILFIPDESNQTASYCTNRKNYIYEYIQVKLPSIELESSIIKGCFSTLDSIPKKDAYITVLNSNTGEIAGVYKTSPLTGQYLMILNSGTKYDISVESEGYSNQTSSFEIPAKKGEFELKQIIKLQTIANLKTIKVSNYFTATEAAKISFDIAATKTSSLQINKGKTNADLVQKKIASTKKAKRTPEEIEEDRRFLKQASDLYNQALYQEAALIYKNLENFIDLEPVDSYKHGLCLYLTVKDKTICIPKFESSLSLKTIPPIVYYYLAKSSYMSYRFSTAINYYKKFMVLGKVDEIKSLEIEKEIAHCYSGIKLVNNPIVLEVYGKKHVSLNAIQNSLTQIESGGKILVIAEDMRSAIDKKKNFNSLLFLTSDKNIVLYSSYGENETNGKDIYQLKKMANGKWTPMPLNIASINSVFDEEYPSLSKDGKTLYFSSKGYENMGGYDIFKSVWDEKLEIWSAPVNLGSPINSPFDDVYFLE